MLRQLRMSKLVMNVLCLLLLVSNLVLAGRPPKPDEACAMFRADDEQTGRTRQASYIEIGTTDASDRFNLSMEVLPSKYNNAGILFYIGWRPDYVQNTETQLLVVAFVNLELSLTVKARGTNSLRMIYVPRGGDQPYVISDARWHTVNVVRRAGKWIVGIDDITVDQTVSHYTDVQLYDKPAFIGGRPGFLHHQFSGVIRRVQLNGHSVPIGDGSTAGEVEVMPCRSSEVNGFVATLKADRLFASSTII